MIEWETPDTIDDLVETLEKNLVTHLEFYDTLTNYDIAKLKPALEANTSVVAIRFVQNGMREDDIVGLCSTLKSLTKLRELNIQRNDTNDDAVIELCELLANKSCELNSLMIKQGKVGNIGASALAKALTKNASVVSLILDGNQVGDDGAHELSLYLASPGCTLKELSLYENSLSVLGATSLATALTKNKSLEDLLVDKNKIVGQGITRMKTAVESNTLLQRFSCKDQQLTLQEEALFAEQKELTLEDELGEFAHMFANVTGPTVNKLDATLNQNRERLFQSVVASPDVAPWMKTNLFVVGAAGVGKSSTIASMKGSAFFSNDNSNQSAVKVTKVIITQYENWKNRDTSSNILPFAYRRYADMVGRSQKSEKYGGIKDGSVREYEATPVALSETTKVACKEYHYVHNDYLMALKIKHHIKLDVREFSGKDMHRTLDHFFQTKQGLYLVVFDMCDFKGKNGGEATLENVKAQMMSINLTSDKAKIFLVGTKLDSAPGVEAYANFEGTFDEEDDMDEEEIIEKINDKLTSIGVDDNEQIVINKEEDDIVFWPLSNKESRGISRLMDQLRIEMSAVDGLETLVSSRWLLLLDLWTSSHAHCLTMKQALNIGDAQGFKTTEIDQMVHVFHELGAVVYIPTLDIIVTDVQWLSDRLNVGMRDLAINPLAASQLEGLGNSHVEAAKNGFWTKETIEVELGKGSVGYDVIVKVLEDQLLWARVDSSKPAKYIPVSAARSREEKLDLKNGLEMAASVIFDSYATGIYDRFVAACMTHGKPDKGKSAELGPDGCKVWMGSSALVLVDNTQEKSIQVFMDSDPGASLIKSLERMMKFVEKSMPFVTLSYKVQK